MGIRERRREMINTLNDPLPEDIGVQCSFAVSLALQTTIVHRDPEKINKSANATVKYLLQSTSVIPVFLFLKVLLIRTPQYAETEEYRNFFRDNQDKCSEIAQLPGVMGE